MSSETTVAATTARRQDLLFAFHWRTAGVVILTLTVLWTFWVGELLWFQGDMMIGFHPAVLSYLVLPWLLALMILAGLVMRRWFFVVLCAAALSFPLGMFRWGRNLEAMAWERSIRDHATANTAALAKVPLFVPMDEENLQDIYRQDAKLTVISDFKWYCEQHIAAENGVFRGFAVLGIPHVRIQKIRHGYRGLAYFSHPTDLSKLPMAGLFLYQETSMPGWVIWTMEE